MIQYFQLTPEILLEYIYDNDPKLNEDGVEGNKKDIYGDSPTMMLKSNAFGSKYLCFKDNADSESEWDSEKWVNYSNLVLPLNNNETQFVRPKNKYMDFYSKLNTSNMYFTKEGTKYIYEYTNYEDVIQNSKQSCNVKYDKCVLHFTSRNYFGSYDSLIFQAYVYMSNKTKLYLASFLFKKTSDVKLKSDNLLYNEKLYTKQIEFDIPSMFAILHTSSKYQDSDLNDSIKGQIKFIEALKSQNIEILENTPIGINVYGVSSSTIGDDNYEKLKTLKISNITIPYVYNRLDEIHVNIYEAKDGDYYCIDPDIGPKYTSFVDYIESMGENVRAYMVMHELHLKEIWVDNDGQPQEEITHKEFHIVNIDEYDGDKEISDRFDKEIKYRPICIRGGLNYRAVIIDTIKIINTVDSSSYEVTGSLEIANPNKYGKKMSRIGIKNESRPIVNVYNKKVSDNNGSKSISLNKGGGFVVENHSQNITSFIECTNIGVSVVELSPDDIN